MCGRGRPRRRRWQPGSVTASRQGLPAHRIVAQAVRCGRRDGRQCLARRAARSGLLLHSVGSKLRFRTNLPQECSDRPDLRTLDGPVGRSGPAIGHVVRAAPKDSVVSRGSVLCGVVVSLCGNLSGRISDGRHGISVVPNACVVSRGLAAWRVAAMRSMAAVSRGIGCRSGPSAVRQRRATAYAFSPVSREAA